MSFYAELRRRKWYCVNGVNMIRFYRTYLYDIWYNSLSEDDKRYLEEYKKKSREKAEKEVQNAMMRMLKIFDIFYN